MRRLLRWAFNVSAAVSALLLVVVCVLWVRSYSGEDVLPFTFRGTLWVAESGRGAVVLSNRPQRDLEGRQHDEAREAADEEALVAAKRFMLQEYLERTSRSTGRAAEADAMLPELNRLRQVLANRRKHMDAVHMSPRCPTPAKRVAIPHAALAAVLAILPVSWITLSLLRARRVRHRLRRGVCPSCGYDLRATPDKGGPLLARCPECGAVPKPSNA